jgi:hypothetical protein
MEFHWKHQAERTLRRNYAKRLLNYMTELVLGVGHQMRGSILIISIQKVREETLPSGTFNHYVKVAVI